MKNNQNSSLAAGAIACLLWSGSIIASKASYDSWGPFALGLIRFGLAAVVLLAMVAFAKARGREERRPLGRDMVICAGTGLIGTTLYFACENVGAMLLPASTASLIVGSFPAMCLALECLWRHVRPQAGKVAGIAIAFAGVAMLALLETSGGSGDAALGVLVLIVAGLSWAVFNLMMGPLMQRYTTLSVTAWHTVFGALGFIPLALVEGLPTAAPSPVALASLAYLVLGCTVAAYVLYNVSLRGLSASAAGSLVNLIPVFGLILSALILGEKISLQQVLGGCLVVAGIFLSARDSGEASDSAEAEHGKADRGEGDRA